MLAGEDGVGLEKRDLMEAMFDEDDLAQHERRERGRPQLTPWTPRISIFPDDNICEETAPPPGKCEIGHNRRNSSFVGSVGGQ